jgi:hypothetical protein
MPNHGRRRGLHDRASIGTAGGLVGSGDAFSGGARDADADSSDINSASIDGARVADRNGDCVGPSDAGDELRGPRP